MKTTYAIHAKRLSIAISEILTQNMKGNIMQCQAELEYISTLINEYLNTMGPASKIAVSERAQIAISKIAVVLMNAEVNAPAPAVAPAINDSLPLNLEGE